MIKLFTSHGVGIVIRITLVMSSHSVLPGWKCPRGTIGFHRSNPAEEDLEESH